MDDETTFGVELCRKSYVEAVRNGWLSDYRIIALGINDREAFGQANLLAHNTKSKKQSLTTAHYLRGLAFALAIGGATRTHEDGSVPIKSCIAFMNTVDKSKNMAEDLKTVPVREWLQNWLHENGEGQTATQYTLEHLDATSNVTARENAKLRLARSSETKPHGIINVGIFGEGTDSPSLSAVAFLEPRKSPIDVIQAVGRVMRTAPGKEMGYIICPILIPPTADPERWLSTSGMEEGWSELGQILLALRAHDSRIEDSLDQLLHLYLPKPPEVQRTLVAFVSGSGEKKRIQYREHEGPPGEAQEAVERVLDGKSTPAKEFSPLRRSDPSAEHLPELTQIITGKKNNDGSNELRIDTVVRARPSSREVRGEVDIKKSKDKARKMINKGEGKRINVGSEKKTRPTREERMSRQLLLLSEMGEYGRAISMNLLTKSGLAENRALRDLNILENSIKEASHHLRNDELKPELDRHFGLSNLDEKKRKKQADGCTIAALLLMNAAMLHQRIADGNWISHISDLKEIKNDPKVVRRVRREWNRILRHDFRPVLEPAVRSIEAVEDTGKLAGLERALRHIAAESERIAETYADMGADHAGPLFNRVMGNQASDGAYFTRPVAASIAARLSLDACGDVDWTDSDVWRDHKTVDLACGSGTLLTAILTEMKRRAGKQGAGETEIAGLQKLAVEDTIKGLDINPISLQLAAAQLTTGNKEIRYRRMGLHLMPYGPENMHVSAGTLELLGQKAIVPRKNELDLSDVKIKSQTVWNQADDTELEDAVDAVREARIVIMNPPFTNRTKMGEKFTKEVQKTLRSRADHMERILVRNDAEMKNFVDKNSIRQMFVALADRCLRSQGGVLTMISPTIALSATSGLSERRILAQRYHIHTVLTCHQPGQVNLSQNTGINESIIVVKRHDGPIKPPTRFINLDRMPSEEAEVADLHRCLLSCSIGTIEDGWGEVSQWPAERIEGGDWTPAVWRSPELSKASSRYSNHPKLHGIKETGLSVHATGQLLSGSFETTENHVSGSFPILKSKGADGQKTIQSAPDEYWIPKKRDEEARKQNGGVYPEVEKILQKAGHLLITAGQDSSAGRLTATAGDEKYVGYGWRPVTGFSVEEAKAIAVWVNSTVGRLQLMRIPGRKLSFPSYSAAEVENIKIPNVGDGRVCRVLSDCWEHTKDMIVPQFRDGECDVRRLWDEAVTEAMGWNADELVRLRELLGNEPHVRSLGYNQYEDEEQDKVL